MALPEGNFGANWLMALDFKEDLHRECFRADYVSVSDPAAVDSALMPVSF